MPGDDGSLIEDFSGKERLTKDYVPKIKIGVVAITSKCRFIMIALLL